MMKLKKKNVARLASISALGAGALGVAGGTAEAGTIQYTALNREIGVSGTTKPVGVASTFNVPIVPGISAYFRRSALGKQTPNSFGDRVGLSARLATSINSASGILRFATATAQPGQKWVPHNTPNVAAISLGRRSRSTSSGSVFNRHAGPNGDYYKLFAFAKSYYAQVDYGWIHLNETVSATGGPDVNILGIAYDASGAFIAAGDRGSTGSTAPEPSTAAMASLSALALGAVGLRRWRAVRKQAA